MEDRVAHPAVFTFAFCLLPFAFTIIAPAMIVRFPDPRDATPEGIVAFGGRPDPELLVEAYSNGIFPWPVEGYPLLWFSPPERAILVFDELHVARSLARERQRTRLSFTIDRAFSRVIESCAAV